MLSELFSLWLKLFFVLTPFFALTMFLSLTNDLDERKRKARALSVGCAVAIICLTLLFAGKQLFYVFGITLDSFKIGAGILLLLSGIGLVQGRSNTVNASAGGDVIVVPMAIPIIVGPATTGTLLVMGAELDSVSAKLMGSSALLLAVAALTLILMTASMIERLLGARGISIISRLTGLILVALAAEMIMTGVTNFLGI